jgi:hypothetical protein
MCKPPPVSTPDLAEARDSVLPNRGGSIQGLVGVGGGEGGAGGTRSRRAGSRFWRSELGLGSQGFQITRPENEERARSKEIPLALCVPICGGAINRFYSRVRQIGAI